MTDENSPRSSSALFKYLIPSDNDIRFNAYINAVGSQNIVPNSEYPLRAHPADYYFNTEKGRVLHEWQLLYIAEGKGWFWSTETRHMEIETGTVILLRPGEWHSYWPCSTTGWVEYYIGFDGEIFSRMLQLLGLDKGTQTWKIGLNSDLLMLYKRAIEIASAKKISAQPLLAGIVYHMLGLLQYAMRNPISDPTACLLERAVEKAKVLMEQRIAEDLDLHALASELNLSYSWFRKTFKDYTGYSPARYFQHLKLRRAERMLSDSQMSIKEIAFSLGFKSTEHFFTTFKKATGHTPTGYRNYGLDREKPMHK